MAVYVRYQTQSRRPPLKQGPLLAGCGPSVASASDPKRTEKNEHRLGNLRFVVPIDLPTGFSNVRLNRRFVLDPAVESCVLVRPRRTYPPFVDEEAAGRIHVTLHEYHVAAVLAISYLASDANWNGHLELTAI